MHRNSLILLTALFALALGACREIPSDRLYALRLEAAPGESDWERALPRMVSVKGGRVHKEVLLADIDEDTVHTTTASCHHGASLPDPVAVDMRAFYTDADLYLRLSWKDATFDAAMREWTFDGVQWHNGGGAEDGFGLIFDAKSHFQRFSCSFACHIDDFGVSGANFHATNKMKLVEKGEWVDLWNWKAQRTGRHGFADDRYLDPEGMHGDTPGEIFRENSKARVAATIPPFAEGDAPIYDAEGLSVGKEFRPAGSRAPGYLTERPIGGRGDVAAFAVWKNGRWTVTLRRSLNTGDPRDVTFVPGDPAGIAFGLSVMDNTLLEHYASTTLERIVLMPKNQSDFTGQAD